MRDWAKQKNPQRSRSAARPSSQARSELIKSGIVCIFLATIIWIVFAQTLRHDFINYDDNEYVCENPRIVSGLSLNGIQWAFSHAHAGNWHQLTTISHMLTCQLYDLQTW